MNTKLGMILFLFSAQLACHVDTRGQTEPCDLSRQDCPDGKKCALAEDPWNFYPVAEGSKNYPVCVPIVGNKNIGESCNIYGGGFPDFFWRGLDDCGRGLYCGDGRCRDWCNEDLECPLSGRICLDNSDMEPGLNISWCRDCDPLTQNCPSGLMCSLNTMLQVFQCIDPAVHLLSEYEHCDFYGSGVDAICGPGLLCQYDSKCGEYDGDNSCCLPMCRDGERLCDPLDICKEYPFFEGPSGSYSGINTCTSATMADLTCEIYCETIERNCEEDHAQFFEDGLGHTLCPMICPAFQIGNPADQTGNSLGCRSYHARASVSDPANHCALAGPSGGGICGDRCEAFCAIAKEICDATYVDEATCMNECASFDDSVPYDVTQTSGNTFACRFYYLTAGDCGLITLSSPACQG